MRRNDAICEAQKRPPERPLRSMGLYSHSAGKRQPRLGPSPQSLNISDYMSGVFGLRAILTLWADVQMRCKVLPLAPFASSSPADSFSERFDCNLLGNGCCAGASGAVK